MMRSLQSLVLVLLLGPLTPFCSHSMNVEDPGVENMGGSPSSLLTPWDGKRIYTYNHTKVRRALRRQKRSYADQCSKTLSLEFTNYYKIKSPYFPKKNYKPGSRCDWTFVGSNLCHPQIVCPVVEIKDAEGCEEDFLSITDAIGGGMKMCGSAGFIRPVVASLGGRTLFLSFQGETPARGFTCEISCAKPKQKSDAEKVMHRQELFAVNRTEIDPDVVDFLPMTASAPQMSSKCVCGMSGPPKAKGGRIAGGVAAKKDEFPWQAALVGGNRSRRPMCGASIINNLYILTAAHCFFRYNDTTKKLDVPDQWVTWRVLIHALTLDANNKTAYATNDKAKEGEAGWMYTPGWNLSAETDASEKSKRFRIEKYILHPLYNKTTFDYDAALIKVDTPINIEGGDLVTPICLPRPSESAMRYGGMKPYVVGWGLANEKAGSTTRSLQKLAVPVYHLDKCMDIMKGIKLFERLICAGYPEGDKDACQGDSGGPLALETNKQWTQIGIVSSGDGCARKNRLGLYTRVTEILGWIQLESNIDIDDDGDEVEEEEGRVLWCQRDINGLNKKKS